MPPRQNPTSHVRPADQPGGPLSLIKSLHCAFWVAKIPMLLHSHSEDSDQTGMMPRLICVFTGRIGHILLELSCCGLISNAILKRKLCLQNA